MPSSHCLLCWYISVDSAIMFCLGCCTDPLAGLVASALVPGQYGLTKIYRDMSFLVQSPPELAKLFRVNINTYKNLQCLSGSTPILLRSHVTAATKMVLLLYLEHFWHTPHQGLCSCKVLYPLRRWFFPQSATACTILPSGT